MRGYSVFKTKQNTKNVNEFQENEHSASLLKGILCHVTMTDTLGSSQASGCKS